MSDGNGSHHSSIEHMDKAHYDVPVDEQPPIPTAPQLEPQTSIHEAHEQKKSDENPLPVPPYPERGQTINDQVAFDFSLNQADDVATFKLDLNDRDPYKQNQGLKTGFLEVFAEPDPTYHSIACVWTFSFRTFEITRIYVYKILTHILALPPLIRLLRIGLQQIFIVWPMILIYMVRPCFYSVGAVFSTFRLHQTKGPIVKEPWMVLVERP